MTLEFIKSQTYNIVEITYIMHNKRHIASLIDDLEIPNPKIVFLKPFELNLDEIIILKKELERLIGRKS